MSRILISFSLALVVAGCTAPGQEETFDHVERLSGAEGLVWQRGPEAEAAVARRVQDLLGEPLTISRAVELALLNNPDLQARFEEVGIARAEVMEAGRPHNPVFETAARFPEGGGRVELDLGLTTSLFDIFLIPARTRAAEAALEARQLGVADAVRALAHQAARAAIAYHAARQAREAALELQAVSDAALSYARALHEAGNIPDLDLADHETVAAEALLAAETATLELTLARATLNRVMGFAGDVSKGANGTTWVWTDRALPAFRIVEPPLPVILHRLAALAEANRLDLKAARRHVDSVAERRGIAVTWIGIDEIEGGLEAERGEEGWAIGPGFAISLPVFDQGQADVSRLDAELRQARRTYQSLALDTAREVRDAVERLYRSSVALRHYGGRLLPLYERSVSLARQNYNYMIEGAFDLLERKRREIEARRDCFMVERDYRLALADLERALGAPAPPDIFMMEENFTKEENFMDDNIPMESGAAEDHHPEQQHEQQHEQHPEHHMHHSVEGD